MALREKFTSEEKLTSDCNPLITSNYKASKYDFERGQDILIVQVPGTYS